MRSHLLRALLVIILTANVCWLPSAMQFNPYSTLPLREFVLCAPGNSALGECAAFVSLGAAFVEVSNSAARTNLELSDSTNFRAIVNMSVAATTGDMLIQCDTDSAFGSPTTLGQVDNPAGGITYGSWTAIPAGECKTSGGVYIRAGMANGNTVESPVIRQVRLQIR